MPLLSAKLANSCMPHINPHLDAVYHILRYLKSYPGLGLYYTSGPQHGLSGYTDANYAENLTDRRSTSDFYMFHGDHLISWKSKKQVVVSKSSVKSEYRAMAQGACEILWLKSLMGEMGFPSKELSTIFCDNKSAICLASDSVLHERTKHIEVDIHFIQQKIRCGIISTSYISLSYQKADFLTKFVGPTLLKSSIGKLGLLDIFAPV